MNSFSTEKKTFFFFFSLDLLLASSLYYLDSASLWALNRASSATPPSLEGLGGVEDRLVTEGMRGGGAPTRPAGVLVRMPLGMCD